MPQGRHSHTVGRRQDCGHLTQATQASMAIGARGMRHHAVASAAGRQHLTVGDLTIPAALRLSRLPRQLNLTQLDIDALELFLRRAGQLNPAREHELAEMVAPMYATRFSARYHNPVRFLALLYHRATRGDAA